MTNGGPSHPDLVVDSDVIVVGAAGRPTTARYRPPAA